MDKFILVQHLNFINSVISETFRCTKRIKLTCFDVSEEYIVFGASSGGIYIFKREPCEFLKLIPSKEGSAIRIAIGPNGKNMAIGSSKGLIIILEDFLDLNVNPLIHSEHEGSVITAIKWHGNTVYSGDDAGRVAVFLLSNVLTIFQTASATLMHLDSEIVQLDTYSCYIIVSTKTKTYLCDTEKECYKQIGKKLRDGSYGACFFNVTNNDSPEVYQSFKGIFKTITEDESFMTPLNNCDVKIYCARPGARLWEANFEATVLVTYQFRDSLNQSPSDLLLLEYGENARLNINSFKDISGVSKNFNFSKIYPILSRFIFTYDSEGFYLFDPTLSKLAFWNNCFKNIKQIIVQKSVIYIWLDNLQINVISLDVLEELIIKTLLNKQYYVCAELCTTYYDDVLNLIECSKKIHLISILKTKLVELNASEFLEKVTPLLHILEKFNKKQAVGKKLKNGIVVIENSHKQILDYDNIYVPESVKNFKSTSSNENKDDDIKLLNGKQAFQDEKFNKYEDIKPQKTHIEENTNLSAIYKQFQLNKSHKNVELTESADVMNKLNLDELFILFQDFVKYVESSETTEATLWCKEQFLKHASKKDVDLESIDAANALSFLSETFLEICNSSNLTCKCNFPLPKARKKYPEYYNLGCKLLSYCDNNDTFLTNVPYMHKYVLSRIKTLNDVQNLPLIVQFNDEDLFEQFLTLFTYDTWDEIIKLYIKLKQGKCLNCDLSIEADDVFPWSTLGKFMVKSIGPQNTTRLLKRYSQYIPNGSLDTTFYQCCILASTLNEPGLAVDFTDKILTETILPEFENQMEKFLQKRYLGCHEQQIKRGYGSTEDSLKCGYCDISLHGSIFSDSQKCEHGHSFHNLCFSYIKGICNICPKT